MAKRTKAIIVITIACLYMIALSVAAYYTPEDMFDRYYKQFSK